MLVMLETGSRISLGVDEGFVVAAVVVVGTQACRHVLLQVYHH